MVMPRSLSGLQTAIGSIVVAWLLPDQLPLGTPLTWLSCAPSGTMKTEGFVLFEALPAPTLVIRVFMLLNALSICVPPEPRVAFVLVSSSEARLEAALVMAEPLMLVVSGE